MSIHILEGNIVSAKVDAIVNAANPVMLGGGGVDGAIHEAAGPELLEECRRVDAVNGVRCPFGEARITGAGKLPCKYVIHTAGPIYRNEKDPNRVLRSSYENCLKLAIEHDCKSIAFPAISCGAYRFPETIAAKIAIEVCSQPRYQNLQIYFYLYGRYMYQIWENAYKSSIK
ncbi:MAG: O-acetyl-ADP-ribose deacetylase [Desulfobacterales bacterium]|nr:MAG: O-acetyl-ADP-ribose deacetylase [Desulfobacterales bacterium]